jgi:transposase
MIFSKDLRKRAVEAVNSQKMGIKEVIEIFKISRRTIYNWLKIHKQTGSFEAKIGYQKGHNHKIVNLDLFKECVELNKECTATEIASRWEEQTTEKVSKSTVLRCIKKIGYTSKKKLFTIAKQTKK